MSSTPPTATSVSNSPTVIGVVAVRPFAPRSPLVTLAADRLNVYRQSWRHLDAATAALDGTLAEPLHRPEERGALASPEPRRVPGRGSGRMLVSRSLYEPLR
jgi:hypothetical protein